MGKQWKKRISDEDIARIHIKECESSHLNRIVDFTDALTTWRSKSKKYSTYFNGIKKAIANTGNGRVYFDFRMEGTVTGRLSCGGYGSLKHTLTKKGKETVEVEPLGVSLHTLERDDESTPEELEESIRQVFICEEDEDFITGDIKAAELRLLAHISQDKNMIKMCESGEDPHKYTASLAYEVPLDKVTKEQRQTAKSATFLIMYGGGAWKLSRTCNISIQAAQAVIDRLKEIYPGVFIWMDKIRADIYRDHYVTSIFGRRRNLPDIVSKVEKIRDKCIRQGVNFVIQSSASDVVCYMLVDIYNEFKFRGLKARVAGTVHDSIEAICPKTETEEVLQIMNYKMVNYPLLRSIGIILSVPIMSEIEVGRSFSGGRKIEFSKKGAVLNYGNSHV